MALLSIFQRKSGGERARKAPPPTGADAVQEARTRARRRLIGAVVLVVIGVIGFPILFETEPRPIPVDIPIEIPRKDVVPPLATPPARPAGETAEQAPPRTSSPADTGGNARSQANHSPAAANATPQPSESRSTSTPAKERKPEPVAVKPAAVPEKPAAPAAVATGEGQRARALLEGQSAEREAVAKERARFVVQVGAFADSGAAREVRQKVEKLGLKTYTQVAHTSSGNRTRVRVGPFSSREEADRAQAKIKATGTPAVVLTL
jgi:DedD protein